MAKWNEVNEIISYLVDAYPRAEIRSETVMIYTQLLSDLDTNHLRAAALDHITKSNWFPSVHQLRSSAIEIQKRANKVPSPAEAWQEMLEAPADGHVRAITDKKDDQGRIIVMVSEYEFSHILVEKVAKNLGWPDKFWTDNLVSDRSKFIKHYEIELERGTGDALSLPEVNDYVASRMTEPQPLKKLLAGIGGNNAKNQHE